MSATSTGGHIDQNRGNNRSPHDRPLCWLHSTAPLLT